MIAVDLPFLEINKFFKRHRDIVAIMETQYNDLHNWSATMDAKKIFGNYTQGRRVSGVIVYVIERFDRWWYDRVNSLWV